MFNAGDGVDEIDDNGGADIDVLSIVGYSSTDATFAYATGDKASLVITLPGGDQVTIRNGLTNSFADNIEQITFSGDGVTLTPTDITDILNAQQITAGDDAVYGTVFNETIEAGTGDDYVSGGDGSDLYLFNTGDGRDVIDENGGADTDVVRFTGYASTDATFSFDNADRTTLVVDFGGGDSVTIRNTLQNSFADAIEQLVFDGDGVTLTMADVRAMLVEQQQSAGDDNVQGFSQGDMIDGGLGDDYLSGRDASDVYSYTLGDGSDLIDDNGGADTDQLVIDGVLSTDVSFAREPGYPNSLVITMPDGATVTIRDQLNNSFADTIEQVTFTADGVTLSPADLRAAVLAAESTGGDDTIIGFNQSDTITGGLGDDYLIGGDGSDTFVFNVGDGDDIVHDQGAADTDALLFVGRNIADATFQALVPGSDDLLITFANGDSVIVVDGLAGSFSNNIEQFQFDDGTLTSADVLLLV